MCHYSNRVRLHSDLILLLGLDRLLLVPTVIIYSRYQALSFSSIHDVYTYTQRIMQFFAVVSDAKMMNRNLGCIYCHCGNDTRSIDTRET